MQLQRRQRIDQILQYLIVTLFNLLAFLTPFIFTWFNQELFEFNKMIFVYSLTILIVMLYLARMIIRQQWLWHWQKGDVLVGLFLLSQIIATVFSMHPRTSWFGYYTRFNGGLLSTISYLALFYALKNNLNNNHKQLLIRTLLLSSLLVSLYAIPEHFGHSLSCLIVTHKFNVACWVQDVQNRVFATFGQPNWLAAFLVMIIPLNVYQIWHKPKTWWWYLLLIINGFALLFTKSRSGLLALAIALVVQLVLKITGTAKKATKKRAKTWLKILLPSLLIALLTILMRSNLSLSAPSNDLSGTDNTTAVTQEGGSKSSDIRRVVWRGALDVWKRYPLFGSGVESFAYSYYQDRPVSHNLLSEWDFLYNKAHNELLNYLATTGLFGLLTYLGLFIALLWPLLQKWRQRQLTGLQVAIVASLAAMFTSNFFGFSTVMVNLLFVILAAILIPSTNWPKLRKQHQQSWPLLLLLPLLLVSGYLELQTWKIWQADYLFTNGSNYLSQNDYPSGLALLQQAIDQSPQEALFYDELASQYSQLALTLAETGDSSSSAQLAQAAWLTSNHVLELNPVHLNFYKSRAKIFIRLAQLDSGFYQLAQQTLTQAIELAPTDAKLYYNLGLVDDLLEEQAAAQEQLIKAIQLRPNYTQARLQLAQWLTAEQQLEEAASEYRYILDNLEPENVLIKQQLLDLEASISGNVEL